MRNLLVVCLAVSCSLISATIASADIVVPGGNATVEGNGNNAFPFNITGSMRYQQVYSASAFTSEVLITGMFFRPDATFGDPFAVTQPNVQVNLSTTTAGPDALALAFALNVGADDTIVRSGSLPLSSANTGPASGPKDFDIFIGFTMPFAYDPALGNLLLDVRNFSGVPTVQFDAQIVAGDAVSRLFAFGASSLTGSADTLGLVTAFQTEPIEAELVPEPSTLLLVGSALVPVARRIRQRRSARR